MTTLAYLLWQYRQQHPEEASPEAFVAWAQAQLDGHRVRDVRHQALPPEYRSPWLVEFHDGVVTQLALGLGGLSETDKAFLETHPIVAAYAARSRAMGWTEAPPVVDATPDALVAWEPQA